jgi:hypothetical protein
MRREDILKEMDLAFKQDRDRFFKVADSLYLQPKYKEHLEELEELKQIWRDIPQQDDYPNFTHPVPLPEWFPKVKFASCWEKDKFIEEEVIKEEVIDNAS